MNNIYRMYNLNTGKVVMERKEYYSINYDSNEPIIRFFANYMSFNNDIYEIMNNGMFEKRDMNDIEIRKLIAKIVKERNLENSFRFTKYDGKIYNYDDLYNENLYIYLIRDSKYDYMYIENYDFDIDLLIKNIPEDFQPANNNWEPWKKGDKIRMDRPVSIDKIHPFRENIWLFPVYIVEREKYWERHVGLYNASENQWAIPPIEHDTFADFRLTGYDNWICYSSDKMLRPYFYNLKTREKYKDKYMYQFGTMIYLGYYDNKFSNQEVIIEKF